MRKHTHRKKGGFLRQFTRWRRNVNLIKAAQENDVRKLQKLLDDGGDIETTDSHGNTPLGNASIFRSVGCIQLLLERRANIEHRNIFGMTPLLNLLESIVISNREYDTECLRLLLENGANPTVIDYSTGHDVLYYAQRLCTHEQVELLQEYRARDTIDDKDLKATEMEKKMRDKLKHLNEQQEYNKLYSWFVIPKQNSTESEEGKTQNEKCDGTIDELSYEDLENPAFQLYEYDYDTENTERKFKRHCVNFETLKDLQKSGKVNENPFNRDVFIPTYKKFVSQLIEKNGKNPYASPTQGGRAHTKKHHKFRPR